ncbi:MAG: hypothetical protein D6741_09600, partial [Planctomycetota bacterium]
MVETQPAKPTGGFGRRRLIFGGLAVAGLVAVVVFHGALLRWFVSPLLGAPPTIDDVDVIWLRSDNGTSPCGDGAID